MTKGDETGRPSQRPARNRAGGNQSPADKRKAKAQGWGCVSVIVLLVAGGILWSLYDEGVFDKKPAKDAPVFGPEQVGRLVEQLSTAADAQGVCYGWVIDSGRFDKIKQLTPSYPGTFRPHPPKQAPGQAPRQARSSPSAGAGAGTRPSASPAPRPAPTGTRPPASAPGSTPPTPGSTPAPTGQAGLDPDMRVELESDLRELDDDGVEYGSNLGAGKDPRQVPGQCAKWVVLEADYSYSSTYNEIVSGRFEIKSSFDERFEERFEETATFERRLGQAGEDDIDGESGTARLRDTIGALPMLVAEEGLAPPVPAETARAAQPPPNDKLTTSTVTTRNVWSVVGIVLIVSAVVWIAVAGVRRLMRGGS